MDIQQRIAQFETMVRPGADPDNDMAWFSLGQAYAQADRYADAAAAFTRCFTINPAMSKAYQLAGKAYLALGDRAAARDVLREGYLAAASRGDRMPMKAMGDMLTELGESPPAGAGAGAGADGGAGGSAGRVPAGGDFVCTRTGKPGHRLPRPPFKGPVGAWIHANISAETWDAWIRQGTKVINELRLDLSNEADSETYDRHMREYLGIDDELLATLTGG
jgi:Fe-S cluster biosynthesis and repair protein YggX